MLLDDTLTFLAAVLSFLGVLLGLLIVGVFSISDKLGLYYSQSMELGKHVQYILKFYGEKNTKDIATLVPKSVDKGLESLARLLRVTIYLSASTGVGLAALIGLLVLLQPSSSEILGSAIAAAFTALSFAVIESVRLVLSVAEMSRVFGKVQTLLTLLNGGNLTLTTRDGKRVPYDPQGSDIDCLSSAFQRSGD